MATSYTRQSSFVDGDTITAALFNDEFNQLLTAFSYASSGTAGHRHDGTPGEGGNIHTIGDQDFLNKIVIDSTNNRWGVYVEVGGAAVEQIRIQDGAIVPVTDNDIDLGTNSLEFKNLYLDGTATVDALVADTADINGGSIDGTTVGASSASTGAFTTLGASGAVTLSDTLSVEGNTTLGNAASDTVTFTADVASDIIPSADSTHDLGDSSNYWANAYIDAITTTGDVAVGGNLTVTGTTTFNGGTLTLGDAASDNVVFGADVNSSIIPNTDNTYDLGSSSQEWRDLYVDGTAYIDSINYNGTAITSTAAELNLVDGSSAGTIVNSKAVVYGAAGEVNATTLQIAGTSITSTAAELNILDGVTATTAEINYLDGVTSNIQTQINGLQSSDQSLVDISQITHVDGKFIVSDGSNWVGETGATARASLGLTIGTHVLAYDSNLQSFVTTFTLPTTDGTSGQALLTDASGNITFGDVDSLPTQTGNSGYYLTTDGTNSSWDNLKASPTFSGTVTFSGTEAITVPVGTTAQRPTAAQGMIRYNTTDSVFEGYTGSAWGSIGAQFAYTRTSATATASQTTFSATYTAGYVDVYLNGVKLISGTDFTATNGTSVVLTSGAAAGDLVEILAYETFQVANALIASNNLSDLSSASTARTNLGLVIGTDVQAYDAQLADVAGLTPTDGNIIIGNGTNFITESGATARASLGLTIGTDVQAYDATTTTSTNTQTLTNKTLAATTLSGQLTGADQTVSAINLKDYGEITNALGNATGAKTIDLTLGNSVTATTTGATTWTFSNPTASDELCSFSLKLVNGGSAAQTWPASVDWPSATAPTLTASGTDVLVFITCDGGTTWYGFVAGLALA